MWFKGVLTDPASRHFKYDYNAYKVKSNLVFLENSLNEIKKYFINKDIELKVIILPYEFQTREINCHTKYLMPQEILVKKLKKLKINYSNYTKDSCAYPKSKTLFYKYLIIILFFQFSLKILEN